MQSAIYQQKYSAILYDAEQFPRPSSSWFEADHWPEAQPASAGRGATWFISGPVWPSVIAPPRVTSSAVSDECVAPAPDTATATVPPESDQIHRQTFEQPYAAVLKHYRRGGWVAPLLGERYWFQSWSQTRAWQEWYLLAQLWQRGLPVARPYMAYAERLGYFYRCALITAVIPQAQTISALAPAQLAEAGLWRDIGRLLKQLCSAGVQHPDFNLSNILCDAQGQLYCIDFDRARYRPDHPYSPLPQIKRLLRSYQRYYQTLGPIQKTYSLPSIEQISQYLTQA